MRGAIDTATATHGASARSSARRARARRAPNQVDIAAAARVSTATVSRVLNHPDAVSEALRRRVRDALEGEGYYLHGAARTLAINRSRTIGAIVPTLESDLFARGIDALLGRLKAREYSLMVVSSDYSLEDETVLVRRLLERGVDGLFLVGQERLPQTAALLARSGVPYVESYVSDSPEREHHVGVSNAGAVRTAVEHLAGLGHRRIGMLAGITRQNDRARHRLAAFRDCMAARGLPAPDSHVREIAYDIDVAREAFGALVDTADPPTALLCGNDLIAMGALIEAQARRLPIPETMSVLGIDNHPMARHTFPPLTTIDVPAHEIGRLSADALLMAIEAGEPVGRRELEAPLIVRGSTGARRGSRRRTR